VVRTPAKCTVCVENRFKNVACLVPGHPCMRELRPELVIAALERALDGTENQGPRTKNQEPATEDGG
jgi:hypothetical protein